MMHTARPWLGIAVWLGCWIAGGLGEWLLVPQSNGAIGATLGFLLGAVAGAAVEGRGVKSPGS